MERYSHSRRATWTFADMECALRDVQQGLPVLKAAEKYKIPRRTLRNHIYNGEITTNMKFMENFDPEKSNREKRKIKKKICGQQQPDSSNGKKNMYNDRGIHIESGLDLCDCLNKSCPGCFYPCSKCHSCKCGHECRVNRKWIYEAFEIHGTDIILRGDYSKSSIEISH